MNIRQASNISQYQSILSMPYNSYKQEHPKEPIDNKNFVQDTINISKEAKQKSESSYADDSFKSYDNDETLSFNIFNSSKKSPYIEKEANQNLKINSSANQESNISYLEYSNLVERAYKQALKDNQVEDSYKDLILNHKKSIKVAQDFQRILSQNKRTVELIKELETPLN